MRTQLDQVRANVADLGRALRWYEERSASRVESYRPPENPSCADFKAVGKFTIADPDGNELGFVRNG